MTDKPKLDNDPSVKTMKTHGGHLYRGTKNRTELRHDLKKATISGIESKKESLTDDLTGLFNRRYFERELTRMIDNGNTDFAILFIDIDRFKDFNDTFGHEIGDDALQYVSRNLNLHSRLRENEDGGGHNDFLVRWGGEEFALVLTNIKNDKVVNNVAERLRVSFVHLNNDPKSGFKIMDVTGSDKKLSLTISIGATRYFDSSDEGSWKKTLARADYALIYAKNQGRNKVDYRGELDANDLKILINSGEIGKKFNV